MKRVAQVISVVFHPLLMTTYLFTLLGFFLPSVLQPLRPSLWFIFLIFLTTFLLPSMNFLFFKLTGTIKDLSLFNRTDRPLPFSLIAILYGVVTLMFYWKFPVPNVLRILLIISAILIISTIVTAFYKVSMHSVGVWGIVGILLPLNKASGEGLLLIPTAVSIVVAGVVMSSRLGLNAHVPREVLVGALLGFGVAFTGVIILF